MDNDLMLPTKASVAMIGVRNTEMHLFTWVARSGRRHPVMGWSSYGVVCPSEVTTNGSIDYLADCLFGRDIVSIEPGVIDPSLPLSLGDKPAFVEMVFNMYVAWKEAGYPAQAPAEATQ